MPGELANNDYARFLGGKRGVLWDCASSEFFPSFSCCLSLNRVQGWKLLIIVIDILHLSHFSFCFVCR